MYYRLENDQIELHNEQINEAILINKENLENSSLTVNQLTVMYNEISGKNIKRFETRNKGIERIIANLGLKAPIELEKEPEAPIVETPEVEAAPTVEAIAETPEAPPVKKTRAPRGSVKPPKRPRKLARDARLVHLFVTNPGKKISFEDAWATLDGVAIRPGTERNPEKKSTSFPVYLSYLRNPDHGLGMRIEKTEDDFLMYVPEKNSRIAFDFANKTKIPEMIKRTDEWLAANNGAYPFED